MRAEATTNAMRCGRGVGALSGALSRLAPVLAVGLALYSAEAAKAQLRGDLNNDCDFDVADVLLLQRHISGDAPIPGLEASGLVDVAPVDGSGNPIPDGLTDVADLLIMTRALNGDVPPPLPGPTSVTDPGISLTESNPVSLSGSNPDGAIVHVVVNGKSIYPLPSVIGESWSGNVPLEDGVNQVQVQAEIAGQLGCLSDPLEVTYGNTIDRDPAGQIVISEDTVWTPGDGTPYRIDDGLVVNSGVVFTVGAGVVIEIDSEFVNTDLIEVAGTLRIRGTSSDPVRLTKIDPPGPNDPIGSLWSSIEIQSTSTESYIEHAVIEYGSDCIRVDGAPATIINTKIRNCERALVLENEAAANLIDSELVWEHSFESGETGVVVDESDGYFQGNLIDGFESCGIESIGDSITGWTANTIRNNGIGICAYGTPNLTLSGNDLINDLQIDAGDLDDFHRIDVSNNWWGTPDPVSISELITDISSHLGGFADFVPFLDDSIAAIPPGQPINLDPAIRYGPISANESIAAGSDLVVLHTLIVPDGLELTLLEGVTLRFEDDASLAVAGKIETLGTTSQPVTLRYVDDVATRNKWTGVILADTSLGSSFAETTIKNTRWGILSNASFDFADGEISSFFLDGVSASSFGVNVSDSVIDARPGGGALGAGIKTGGSASTSSITGNLIAGASKGIDLIGIPGGNVTIFANDLIANTKHLVTTGYSTRTLIDAEYNYWESVVPSEIAAKITDRADQSGNQAVVDFVPFHDSNDQIVDPAGALVGIVDANDTLTAAGGPYEVAGYYGTAPGATLTIEAGSQVSVIDGSFIEVDGGLSLNGTSGNRITLTNASMSAGAWEGIRVSGTGTTTVQHTDIEYADVGVDVLAGADAVLTEVDVNEWNTAGVRYGTGATGSMAGGSISRAAVSLFGTSGVRLDGAGAVSITDVDITNGWDGIRVVGGTPGPISLNRVSTSNPNVGMGVRLESTSPTVSDNEIDGYQLGVWLEASDATVSGNGVEYGIDSPGSIGFRVIGNSPQILDNKIWNYRKGLVLSSGATALVSDNDVHRPNLDPGKGEGIELTDDDSTIELNTIRNYETGIAATAATTSTIGNNELYANLVGIKVSDSTNALVISGNTIDLVDPNPDAVTPHASAANVGISLINASPHITGANTITNHNTGIHLFGASSPLIDGGNEIFGNAVGILLEGTGSAGGNPNPTITGNNIYDNPTSANPANLRLESFYSPEGTVIDATGNWWGTTTSGDIEASIQDQHAEHTIPVDFSLFLIALNGSQILTETDRFTSLLTGVSTNLPRYNVATDLPARILFTISKASTVTMDIFEETDDVRAPANRIAQRSGSFASGAGHWLEWDGRRDDNGALVPDDAYVYVLTIDDGSSQPFIYDPARPGGGSGSGVVTQSLNSYRNAFWTLDYTLSGKPSRVTMTVQPDQGGTFPTIDVFRDRPLPSGVTQVEFNGRDSSGSLWIESGKVVFSTPVGIRPSSIIIEKGTPQVTGSPTIEVRSDPYFVTHSYDHVTKIAYCLDRDAEVTVKILIPGGTDPNNPAHVLGEPLQDDVAASTFTPAVDCAAGAPPYELVWAGLDPGDPNQVLSDADGAYNFTIHAKDTSPDARETLYRGVVQVRQ